MTAFTDKEAAERLLNRHSREVAGYLDNGKPDLAKELLDMRLVDYLERIIAEDEG